MNGSTKNYSNNVSDPIRAVFSMFRANYKNLFKMNYPTPEALNKDMSLWQEKFGGIHPLRLKKTTELCIAEYDYQPNIAQFRKMLAATNEPACHRLYKRLPSPPRTEEEKAERARYFARLKQVIQ